jgi:hypothetical protein
MPGANENIITISKFRGMLKSTQCTNTSMDMTFKDANSFQYAKKTWDWVNGADNHSFVMVANAGDCGWNTYRIPFVITTLTFDDKAYTAHLNASASDWASVAHTYELTVGSLPTAPVSKLRKRFGTITYDKDLTVNFEHPFPISSAT